LEFAPHIDPALIARIAEIVPFIRGALARDSGVEGRPDRVVLAHLEDDYACDSDFVDLPSLDAAEITAHLALQKTDISAFTLPGLGSFGVGETYADASKTATPQGSNSDLAGQVAVVTGGAGGLGLSVAEILRAQGAEIALLDIAKGPVAEAAKKLDGIGLACDVTNPEAVRDAIAQIVAHFGGIDILISNAGAAQQGSLLELDDARFQAAFALNFWSHHYVARSVVRVMQKQRTGGALVFNVSKQAVNPGPEFGAYGTPKAALMALMRQYAVEHGADGITSNAVNADRIRTGLMTDRMVLERSKARGLTPNQYMRGNLVGREVTGRDVAEAFVHLAKARTSTGAVLTVDGGNVAAMMR
jgi:NAD(P)-dependent dehydrogenase (short-subunit alcohol dehydrogenase family)